VIAAAILDPMLLPTDECFTQEVPESISDILQPVVPHFNNHPLATRPVNMDDNARLHRSRAVTAYLQSEAVTSVPWPAIVTYESLDDIYCSKFSTGVYLHLLG
jgi:hypothetical protein